MSGFDITVAELSRQGQHTHGAWDASAFATLVQTAATRLWRALGEREDAAHIAALRAYLRLGQEALVQGLVSASGEAEGFLGRAWTEVIPTLAATVPIERLPGTLVELWNLGEGLRDEGLWLDRAVGRRIELFTALSEVEATIEWILEEIFAPGADPKWERNVTHVLDLRPASDAFVPGWMHLLAPRVVCVHDRRHEDRHLGLWLGPEGGELLGLIDCGETHHDPRPLPVTDFSQECIVGIGQRYAALPLLSRVHASLAVPAGFVVASAVDSQRLWVVHGV